MAALAWVMLAHGGTPGLIIEISTVVLIGGVLLWAAVKSRRSDEGDR